MLLFIICILVTTFLGVCFKLFGIWKIKTFPAIVINYSVCLVLGTLLNPVPELPFTSTYIQQPWFPFVLVMGIMFVTGFYFTGTAVRHVGMTLTTLVQRMSILLSVTFSLIAFKESLNLPEGIGLLLAWFTSGCIESILVFVEKTGKTGTQQMAFTTHSFGFAAIAGWIVLAWQWFVKKNKVRLKDVGAGIMLGLPNYFSIYLLLRLLNEGWKASLLYPALNVTVLVLTSLIGSLAFHERLQAIHRIGIFLAVSAILLIAYAQNLDFWKTLF